MIGNRKQMRHLLIFITLIYGVCDAQFYFGRNKIQYEHFDWRILKTEHFHIYYYQQEEEIARVAAHILEGAYDNLEIKFNHTLWDTVPLMIYSSHIHFQQTNILPRVGLQTERGFTK